MGPQAAMYIGKGTAAGCLGCPRVLSRTTRQHWWSCILHQCSKATPGTQAKPVRLVTLRESCTGQASCSPKVCVFFHPQLSWQGAQSHEQHLAALHLPQELGHLVPHPACGWLHQHLPVFSEGFCSACHIPWCSGLASLLRSWGCLGPCTGDVKSTSLHSPTPPPVLQVCQEKDPGAGAYL